MFEAGDNDQSHVVHSLIGWFGTLLEGKDRVWVILGHLMNGLGNLRFPTLSGFDLSRMFVVMCCLKFVLSFLALCLYQLRLLLSFKSL